MREINYRPLVQRVHSAITMMQSACQQNIAAAEIVVDTACLLHP
jgi:hypothetical protein